MLTTKGKSRAFLARKTMHVNTIIKWGVTLNLVFVLWMFSEKLFGLHDENIHVQTYLTLLANIPFFFIYRYALQEKLRTGHASRRKLILYGVSIAAIAALFSPISQYLTSEVISPNYFKNAIAYAVKSGSATLQDAEAYFTLGSYIPQVVIGTFLSGCLFSVIGAMVLRKNSSG